MALQGWGEGGEPEIFFFLFDFKDKHTIGGGEALRKAPKFKKKKKIQGNVMKSSFFSSVGEKWTKFCLEPPKRKHFLPPHKQIEFF